MFFSAAPAHAATLVQAVKTGTAVTPTTTVTSAALSPAATAGNLLIAIVAANTTTTIDPPAGWSTATESEIGPSQGVYYKFAAGGETTVTATVGSNTGAIAIQVYEYSGASQLTYHLSNTAAGTGTTASTGGITTTKPNELVLAGVVSQINTSPTGWTGGFTQRASFNVGGAAARRSGYGGADLLSSASGLKSPSVTVGSAGWRGTIVSFYDNTAPTLAQVTPVPSPTSDNTPNYTFSSNEAGTITYGGGCSSATTAAAAGNNTITFNTLSDGLHSNCTIVVTDAAGNPSTALSVNAFTVDTAAPTVSNVTSSLGNGAYTVGQIVPVQVVFNEVVVVSGTPQITLSTGSPATTLVNISGGSNSTTLTFNYSVIAGNVTPDLDYASTGALILNGGTIKDAAGNDAVLTLASPGAAGSLGANKDVEINTHVPTIVSVTSTHADGSFTVGEVIPVTVNFSEPVTSTGSVIVTLETGGTDRTCSFTVSNASSGTCNYTVQAGDTTSDLTTNSIAGTIKDSALNAMTNFTPATNLAASKAIVIDTAAPTISSVTSAKANGAYTVGEVIPVTVSFSEPVTSTGSVTVTLETGGTDRTCTFTVSNAASGSCNYIVQSGDTTSDLTTNSIAGTIKDAAQNAVTDFTPGSNLAANSDIVIDTTAPSVSSTNPSNGEADVAITTHPSAAFSETMDGLTITTSTFTLKRGITPVSGTVSYLAGSAHFEPDVDLDPSTTYTAEITTGAKDIVGNALAAPHAWSFTTGAVDTTPPTVTATDPSSGAIDVPVSQVLTVHFSEAMDTGTITSSSFTLKRGLTPVSGTVNPVGDTATFTPSSTLMSSTTYTATLATSIKDLAGNALASAYSWNFTTADVIAPTVSNVTSSLGNGAYTVGQAVPVQVVFNEVVVVSGTPRITLSTGNPATTAVDYVDGTGTDTLIFTYTVIAGNVTADLEYASTGALALNGGFIKDEAGNDAVLTLASPGAAGSLGANKNIEINTHVPTIASVTSTKADGRYTVGAVIPVTVNFSEPVTSTGSVIVTLETGGTDRTCSFTVSNASSGSCDYTVQAGDTTSDLTTNSVAGTIKDSALNAMTNFTPATNLAASKAIVIDTTAPTVGSSTPANGAAGIALNVSPGVSFSETMDDLTINASTFTLKQGLTPVSGTVSYLGTAATFDPDADLAPNTVYTGTITTGAKDPTGNALATAFTWSFTTGSGPDLTPPTVSSVDPPSGATDASTSQVVTVLFDEAMDGATITASTFTLKQGLTTIAGTVLPSGNRATFTPSASLTPGLAYTATLTTGIKDLAGNALASSYSWSFTVAAAQGAGIIVGSTADLTLTLTASPARLPAQGGDVTFTYVVKNSGDVHISSVSVDGEIGAIPCATSYVSGDDDHDGLIDPGTEWIFSCVTKVERSGTHTAKARGAWNFGVGTSESASVFIVVGDVAASANFHFHAEVLPTVLHPGGGAATLLYHVGNLGETPLADVRFIGPPCRLSGPLKGDADNDGLIDQGERWDYACEGEFFATTPLEIYAIVRVGDVEMTEIARVVVSVGTAEPHASIHLHAQANPASLPFGGGLTYLTYHVSNDGNVPLEDVTLVSGSETCASPAFQGGDHDGDRVLDLDERWIYACAETLRETEADAPVVRARAGAEWVSDDALFVVPVASALPPAKDRNATGEFDPVTAAADTPDLDTNLGLAAAGGTTGCVPGIPYKLADDGDPLTQADSTVYYCGRDGMRHAFPNAKTYFSWYADFRNVLIAGRAALEAIPLGAPATYRPGVRMLKTQSDLKVYAVARGGVLRWIASEAVAASLYGADWNAKIDDLPEEFLKDYAIGEPVR